MIPRWAACAIVPLTVACAGTQHREQLADGSWRIECANQVDGCIKQAARTCGQRDYQLVGGGKETKVYGGATGYKSVTDVHTVIVRCGEKPLREPPTESAEAEPQSAGSKPTGSEPKVAPTPREAEQRACVPGATQRCVGPGACEGGQSCKADGSGFEPCDCGSSSGDSPETVPGEAEPPSAK